MTTVTAKIRRIGNSRGILFPKEILEETGLKETVKITVKGSTILISQAPEVKKKTWEDFKKVKVKSPLIINNFDETEWTW
jgi:antitoxin component of MazEF toxin-antitoxin module